MKPLLFFILLFLTSLSQVKSQNLISNPSFEENTGIPNFGGELNLCVDWHSVNGHYFSTGLTFGYGTPDYYYTMIPGGPVNFPNTMFGFLYPNSGNAAAGFIGYSSNRGNVREYIYAHLASPILKDKIYEFSIYINSGTTYSGYGIDKFGVALSNAPLFQDSNEVIHLQPQILFDTLLHTETWKQIKLEFQADSNYEYITIGNFYDDNESNPTNFSCPGGICEAYYFIDDVSLTIKDVNWINENEVAKINIYPNPAREKITIQSEFEINNYQVYDLNSRILQQQTIKNKKEFEVTVSVLAAGVYYIRLETQKGSVVKKIIKEN